MRAPVLVCMSAFAAALLPATAAAKKPKVVEAPAAVDAPAAPVPQAPPDANSQKFAARLMSVQLKEFRPGDGGGAKFIYEEMRFLPDNTWSAKAYVEISGERMDCTESGPWTMDAADSADAAAIGWTVEKTDCAGREAGASLRFHLTIDKSGAAEVKWR